MGAQNSVNIYDKKNSSSAFLSYVAGAEANSDEISVNKSKSSSMNNMDANNKRRRPSSIGDEDDPWGWFEDFGSPHRNESSLLENDVPRQPIQRAMTLPAPVTNPPVYVLEASLSYQRLWYETAGRRPRQPPNEREFYERLWERNFENSSVLIPTSFHRIVCFTHLNFVGAK